MHKTRDEVVNKIILEIVELKLGQVKVEDVEVSRKIIDDYGIDSLDYASLLFTCEEWLDVKVDENAVNWSEVSTIGDLANLLWKSQG